MTTHDLPPSSYHQSVRHLFDPTYWNDTSVVPDTYMEDLFKYSGNNADKTIEQVDEEWERKKKERGI